jgi:O-methyltransferase domain
MSPESPPGREVMHLAVAYWASRCLHVVAELGVADKLGDEPQTAESLARAIGVHPQALHRVLRSLANHGIFVHDGERFAHNAESRTLRSDAPGSMRSLARMMGMKVHWDAYRELDSAVRTGQASIERVTASGLFSYLSEHPQEGRIFDEAMEGKSSMAIALVPQAYDFSAFQTIGDIGGGLGHLLYAVLEKAPRAKGVLFELPDVVARARARNVARVSYVGGDFFKDPIPACDLYMMMTVLHDWSDAQCEAILKNLRAGAPAKAKLLLIEGIVDPSARDAMVLDVDIEMLVMTTGRERTRAEWESVLSRGGFRLTRIVPVGPSGIIEAEAV